MNGKQEKARRRRQIARGLISSPPLVREGDEPFFMNKLSILIPSRDEPDIQKMAEETEIICRELYPESQIIICNDRQGRGKGWALREALVYATGDIICFIDGDLDIHPRMIKRLIHHLREFDIVVGKKDMRGLWSRYVITLLSRLYIYLVFGIKVDTQTGIKIFRCNALPVWLCDSFAFDIEILYKAKKAGASMFEVTVEAKSLTRMKWLSIWKTLIESFKIRSGYA